MSYEAIITKLTNLRKHPNADKLKLGTASGFQVVIDLQQEEEVGVFFPTDGKLSHEMLMNNKLYRKHPETGEPMGGFFELNGRVRCQTFRGEKSEGFWLPLSSLSWTGITLSKCKEGYTFDSLNKQRVCEKYYSPKTLKMKGQSNQEKKKTEESFPIFAKHYDTKKLRYYLYEFNKGDILSFTEKLHGTCLNNLTKITMFDGTKKPIREIKIGDKIIGFNQGEMVCSEVLKTWDHGIGDDWLTLHIDRSFSRNMGTGNSFSAIHCTPAHEILTKEGYKKAKELSLTDLCLVSRKDIIPSEDQTQIIIGKLLGDASLTKNSKHSSGLSFNHKKEHEKYLDYCVKSLTNLGGTGKKCSRISGYGTNMLGVTTKYSSFIKKQFSCFYKKKKIVPEWIKTVLSPIGLAFWYMDDGSLGHTEKQKDRANFATCGFSYDDCVILKEALKYNGIENVTIYKTNEYWRIRINSAKKGADIFFNLIAPYVPKIMEYKLPIEHRGGNKFREYKQGKEYFDWAYTKILKIQKMKNEYSKRKLDLTTTTENFVANDIIIHNSARTMHSLKVSKKRWWNKFLPKIKSWKYISGTRNRILINSLFDSPHMEGIRAEVHALIKSCGLHKGETLYYEIVGFDEFSPIMGIHPIEDKDLKTKYGSQMIYAYGCNELKPYDFYIYRITLTNEDNYKAEYSPQQIQKRCSQLGFKPVPMLKQPFVYDGNEEELIAMCSVYSTGDSSLDKGHIREGLVIRNHTTGKGFKYKNHAFCELEGILKEDENYVDTEEIA